MKQAWEVNYLNWLYLNWLKDKRRVRKALTKILASLCMDCWFWLQQLLKLKNQLQTSVFTELKFEELFLTRKLNQKLKLDNHFMQDFAGNFAASQELIRTLDCQHHHCRKLMNLSVSIIAENIWNESQFEHHCRKQTQECCWICLQFEKNWSLFFLSMREFCKCSSFGSRTGSWWKAIKAKTERREESEPECWERRKILPCVVRRHRVLQFPPVHKLQRISAPFCWSLLLVMPSMRRRSRAAAAAA